TGGLSRWYPKGAGNRWLVGRLSLELAYVLDHVRSHLGEVLGDGGKVAIGIHEAVEQGRNYHLGHCLLEVGKSLEGFLLEACFLLHSLAQLVHHLVALFEDRFPFFRAQGCETLI